MKRNGEAMEELIAVMDRLLAPDGCPWDREQTHESLIRYLIEESYEVIEAIENRDMQELKEELGDLLLQVVFHAALAEREEAFDFADVANGVSGKMIARHPHVFGDMDLRSSDDVMQVWESFKKKEGKKHLLDGIPQGMPALMRAEKVQEKASRVGFDWPDAQGALEKFKEEVDELASAESGPQLEEEMGDVFFALVNIARLKDIEPEQALQHSSDKFIRRFEYIERHLQQQGKSWGQTDLQEMDALWDEAKKKGL